ncbi:MAG: XdhC family protein [Pseudomonadota bacterium]
MYGALLNALNAARAKRDAVAVVTDLAMGEKRLLTRVDAMSDPLADAIGARFLSGKSGVVTHNDAEHFVQVYVPPARFVIIGAVHISQALAPMARACDFDVTIIDPRTAFATEDRFDGTVLHAEWPEQILKDQPLDAYTALVAVTHDPKIDDLPLQAALEAECFYVGALGSRKTHAKRLDRLHGNGLSVEQTDRIAAPIGLDIGAATPSEIAVAVLAQAIEARRRPDTKKPVVITETAAA